MKIQKNQEPLGYTVEGIMGLAGGRSAVAKHLGLSVGAVCHWKQRIPSKYANTVAKLAGVSLRTVRPDMVANEEDIPNVEVIPCQK